VCQHAAPLDEHLRLVIHASHCSPTSNR
jgi:hypothetical protein